MVRLREYHAYEHELQNPFLSNRQSCLDERNHYDQKSQYCDDSLIAKHTPFIRQHDIFISQGKLVNDLQFWQRIFKYEIFVK